MQKEGALMPILLSAKLAVWDFTVWTVVQQIFQAGVYRPKEAIPDTRSCPYSDLACGISRVFEVVFGQTCLLIPYLGTKS